MMKGKRMHEMMEDEMSDESHSDAKLQVLEELRDLAIEMMGKKLRKGEEAPEEMKQVTVAAPDKEGLEAGLEMAKEVAPEMAEEEDDMELDEIEEMIRDLEEKRRQKLMKS